MQRNASDSWLRISLFLSFFAGSGKTYTMQPLPLRATQDIMALMQQPTYRSQGLQLWLSFFEIYGGKLYDLLLWRWIAERFLDSRYESDHHLLST
jgi:hypothetical protein